MIKNIIDPAANSLMLQRIRQLAPDQKCVWGNMNAATMLYHCNCTNQAILHAPPSTKNKTIKQRVLQFLVFSVKNELPKGIKGDKRYFPAESASLSFDALKKEWTETIVQFTSLEQPLEGKHPVFGRLNTHEWGHFVWLHMDHHLRQFGV